MTSHTPPPLTPTADASRCPGGDARPPGLRVVDSITELQASDAGCIAVSASHGGLSSARYALAARPLLVVFNDAGVGKDGAGIAGLALLQAQGIAACTVSHTSACIGQAASTLADGVLSHANAAALAMGLRTGFALAPQVQELTRRHPCPPHPSADTS